MKLFKVPVTMKIMVNIKAENQQEAVELAEKEVQLGMHNEPPVRIEHKVFVPTDFEYVFESA